MKVKITGNVYEYKSKLVGPFTARQFLFALLGLGLGAGTYVLLRQWLPAVISTLLAAIVGLTAAAGGILTVGGLRATEIAARIIMLAAGMGRRPYKTEDWVTDDDEQKRKKRN